LILARKEKGSRACAKVFHSPIVIRLASKDVLGLWKWTVNNADNVRVGDLGFLSEDSLL
jgi:hypothetical protein